jgi:hypothetical protein
MRRSFKSIHYRRAESPRRNSFRNDEIETECIELAHMAKKIGRSFPQILPFAEASHRGEFQGAAVSSPPLGELEIAPSCMPRKQANALILLWRKCFGLINQTQWGCRRIMRRQLPWSGNSLCPGNAYDVCKLG